MSINPYVVMRWFPPWALVSASLETLWIMVNGQRYGFYGALIHIGLAYAAALVLFRLLGKRQRSL